GFSPRLPVSVCGTGTSLLARGFSRQCGIRDFGTSVSLAVTAQRLWCADLPTHPPNRLDAHFQPRDTLPSCVTPSLKRSGGGTGISTCSPSPTPFGLGLGPDLP